MGLQMADEALAVEVETEEVETEETAKVEGETPEAEQSEDDEIVVTIGDESPPSEDEDGLKGPAPDWVKELRKTNREKDKRIRELEAKVSHSAETKPAALGSKPKLEDYDYDAEQFEKALEAYHERKREHDAEEAKKRQAEETQQREWQAKLDAYNADKSKLKIRDFDEAEMVVQETLNQTQQGIILHGAANPALLVAALGKNPKKAKELAAITDPVKFAFAAASLEKELKVTNRKAPPPEKTISGNAGISGAVTGSTLERLADKARQTGDWTEYYAAKRKINSK